MDWIKVKKEHISPLFTDAQIGTLVRFQFLVGELKRMPSEEEMNRTLSKKNLTSLRVRLTSFGVDLDFVASKVLEDVSSVEHKRENNKERQRRFREQKEMSRVSNALRNGPDKIRGDKIREDTLVANATSDHISKKKANKMRNYEEPVVDLDGDGEAIVPEKPGAKDEKLFKELLEGFAPTNRNYKAITAWKGQREAMRRLVKLHGEQKVRKAIFVASKTCGKDYFPLITDFVTLEKKYESLVTAIKRANEENDNHWN